MPPARLGRGDGRLRRDARRAGEGRRASPRGAAGARRGSQLPAGELRGQLSRLPPAPRAGGRERGAGDPRVRRAAPQAAEGTRGGTQGGLHSRAGRGEAPRARGPGRSGGKARRRKSGAPFDEAERLERVASGLLLGGASGCAKCHDVSGGAIARLPDRTVWLPAAQFNHTRHKPTTCATCHPGTTGAITPPGTALVEKEPQQILGIDSCRACHSPSGTKVTFPDGTALTGGGARFGCVDCHRYHNADHGLQGRGADVLWPERPLDLVEFLRGGKYNPAPRRIDWERHARPAAPRDSEPERLLPTRSGAGATPASRCTASRNSAASSPRSGSADPTRPNSCFASAAT